MKIRVTREPLREEQSVVHRHVDPLGRHPERILELRRPDAPAVPDRSLDSRQERAQRHEQLHDRANVKDRPTEEVPRVSSTGAYRPSVTVA